MSNPEFQAAASPPVPPRVTSADTPSSPSGYASVTPHGQGPAPYNIQAPQADLSATMADASALAGAGVLYPKGPRQAATEHMLMSGPGFAAGGGYNITTGYSGGGGDGWPNDIEPDATGP